jgi:hypothetical protein
MSLNTQVPLTSANVRSAFGVTETFVYVPDRI